MSAAQGMLSKLAIDSSSISSSSPRFDFQACTISLVEQFPDLNGIRGQLSHDISRVPVGIRRLGGQIRFEPNAAELALLLPWVMGAAGTGSGPVTYALSDSILTRNVQWDQNIKVRTFTGMGVDHCVLSASQGEPLSMSIDVVGIDETVGTSFTSTATIDTATTPWMFQQCVLVVNSVTTNARNFEVSISNFIDTGRFFNSATLVSLVKRDRVVTTRMTVPYGDSSALYGLANTGVSVVATFTNGGQVLTITMPDVAIPRTSPTVTGRSEVVLELAGQAFASGATKELTISA